MRLQELPGVWSCKIQQVSKVGTPDVLICLAGVFVAIELKTNEGKLSKLQIYNLEKIAQCGGMAMVLTPDNLERNFKILEDLAKSLENKYISNEVIGT